MSKFRQCKCETHTIETNIYSQDDIASHEEEVDKYVKDGWRMLYTKIKYAYENQPPIQKTVLEKFIYNNRNNGNLIGNTEGKNNIETVMKILNQSTSQVKPIIKNRYSSTEEYLLHRIAELEDEVEMFKTLYMRGEINNV